jgi:predicted HTH domain antitoxin
MAVYELEMPDELMAELHLDGEMLSGEARKALAAVWYSKGSLSQETAARMAAMDRASFLMFLKTARIETFKVDPDDLDRELSLG